MMVMVFWICSLPIMWTSNSVIFLVLVPAQLASFAALTSSVDLAGLRVQATACFTITATVHSQMSLSKPAPSTRTAIMGWGSSGLILTTEGAWMLTWPTTRLRISSIVTTFRTDLPKLVWSQVLG